MDRIRKFLESIESEQVPLAYYIATFFGAVMLRTFWEHALLVHSGVATDWGQDHVHYVLFSLSLALSLIVLLHLMTREKVAKVARVVLPGFIALVLVPLIDRVSGARQLFHVTYYFPDQHHDMFLHFFTFFGPLEKMGATPGMRIEIALVVAVAVLYAFVKTCKLGRSLLTGFWVYTLIFAYIATPVVLNELLSFIGFTGEQLILPLFIQLYFLLIFISGFAALGLARRNIFRAIIKDIRGFRLVYYILLIVLGGVCYKRYAVVPMVWGAQEMFRALFLLISVSAAWVFCVISNNWADEAIDRVSNPQRPSITGIVPAALYRRIGWGCLAVAACYGYMVDMPSFEIILVFMGSYFMYSMPPLRLKRIPVLSKFIIGFNSLLMFMLGHIFFAGVTTIPVIIILFFLVFITLSANFIDLKDYEGDRQAGIRTLPVVVGIIGAKRLIGIAFILTYLVAYEAFYLYGYFWVCVAGGLVQYFLINRREYDERPVLTMLIVSLTLIIDYLILSIH